MPFVSQAQRAKFYSTPSLHKYIAEFEAATPKGGKLPKHVRKHKKHQMSHTMVHKVAAPDTSKLNHALGIMMRGK